MLAQSAVSLVKHQRGSADAHEIVLRHVTQQVLHVGNDSCAIRLIVGGEALDEGPAAWSIAVVCIVAISCRPKVLRTISSPLASGA